VRLLRYASDRFFAIFLVFQVIFWYGIPSHDASAPYWKGSRNIFPTLAVVPEVPSSLAVKALSLGDEQFFFRALTLRLQTMGDTFGRFTPLKDYNYPKLQQWFFLLDTLDKRSNFVPSIAAYLFSQSQNTPDVKYVIEYLDKHASPDLYHKWWWMAQAVFLANHKLEDKRWALELAYKLASTPRTDVPIWVQQMPALIHEQLGEKEEALQIIYGIGEKLDKLSPGEMNYMRYFITERLGMMKDKVAKLEAIEAQKKDRPQPKVPFRLPSALP
jgi:hypothetical protein